MEQHHKKTANESQLHLQSPPPLPVPTLLTTQHQHHPPSSSGHTQHQKQQQQHQQHQQHQQQPQPHPQNTPTTTATTSAAAAALPSSAFEYPQSGDESDNHYLRMEHLRSQFYTPDPQKRTKEYHLEQAVQAIELLKAASKSGGWKKVDKHKSGCMVYQSTTAALNPHHGDNKFPAIKGEHVIRGYRAQDVYSIVSVRKLWDDWYDELSCVEKYDDTTSLLYMVMKGTLSSKTRDVAMVERVEVERDGTIYCAACSVESNKIPRISGRVRADIFVAGWIIQPLPSNPPITKITYVIQTDLLSRLPRFIAKRSLAKRALVIATVETYLRKNGVTSSLGGGGPVSAVNRKRSLSEPLKMDRQLLPPDSSEDDLPSGSAFLSPMEPIQSKHSLHRYDSAVDSTEDDERSPASHRRPVQVKAQQSTTTFASTLPRDSLLSSKSLFSQEFLESNSFMGDTVLFGDSVLFGKGGIFESKQSKEETADKAVSFISSAHTNAASTTTLDSRTTLSSSTRQQYSPAHHPSERTRPVIGSRAQHEKRVSIPVVQPKSEARVVNNNIKQAAGGQHHALESVPEPTKDRMITIPTLATPPLTPTASIDGKDAASDSDAAAPPKKPSMLTTSNSSSITSKSTMRESSSIEELAEAVGPSSPTKQGTLGFSSMGMKSPSAMMEARRHSGMLLHRKTSNTFAPRHSHVIPIRGNPNVSLQSLTRPSGPNGTMTSTSAAMKRHSTAPSLDSNRSTTFTPLMILPHRHSETARKALAMFKVLAASPEDRWRAISSENGFKAYSRMISGAGLPMLRSEGTITGGWTVEQINAAIESAGCRQIWDERFDNLSIAETFNHNEYLFHITLKGVGSLTGRDLAGVTIIDRDPQTSALYNVSTSVLDPTIPEDPGRIRALLELSGWSLRPTFDGQGNTVSVNITFVIQIDIRGTLPSSVVKSMTSSMTMAVSRLNQFINKSGYPPFASHISGTRLLDTFDPRNGFYELCYKAAPGWTEVRVGRKVYKDGYDFFIKPDDPSVKVELAPDFGGVRVWTTLDHEGQSIVAQVSRKGHHLIEAAAAAASAAAVASPEVSDSKDAKVEVVRPKAETNSAGKAEVEESEQNAMGFKDGNDLKESEIESSRQYNSSSSRKRRSASYSTLSPHGFAAAIGTSAANHLTHNGRPESQGSERSRASRGRSSRALVTLPAGTPPPPLPHRSSSLSRYSIPLSPYMAGADAPPVPINTTGIRNSSVSVMEPLGSAASSPVSPDRSSTSATLTSPTRPTAIVTSTPATTAVESPMCSPTLGPFHVPHHPVISTSVATASTATTTSALAPKMESISTVLSESETATPVLSEAASPASTTSTVVDKTELVSVATVPVKPSSLLKDNIKKEMDHVSTSILLTSFSPVGSPIPSATPAFGPRTSSLAAASASSSTTSSPSASTAATVTPVSSLKHSTSISSVASTSLVPQGRRREVRVTFSLDTVDKSSMSPTESPSVTLSSNSPLEDLMKFQQQLSRSGSGSHGPTLAKEHSVHVVTSSSNDCHHHQQVVVEQSASVVAGEDSSSDEDEFMEANDDFSDLSEDEKELALVLAGIGAWPSLSSDSSSSEKLRYRSFGVASTFSEEQQQHEKEQQDEIVMASLQAVERGFRDLRSSQIKVAIVFLLLIYYAGHLSMALTA